uniref:Uncharacterized protein n=1 Tax=Arundo donax TaxID=35708 RepID=A0A0A9HAH7_ARUDO
MELHRGAVHQAAFTESDVESNLPWGPRRRRERRKACHCWIRATLSGSEGNVAVACAVRTPLCRRNWTWGALDLTRPAQPLRLP